MVFTKLKAALATLAKPVPVPNDQYPPGNWFWDHGGQGRDDLLPARDLPTAHRSLWRLAWFPCPAIDSFQVGVGTTAGRAGSYASPALPETSLRRADPRRAPAVKMAAWCGSRARSGISGPRWAGRLGTTDSLPETSRARQSSPSRLIVGTTAGRGIGQDSDFPCPRLPVLDQLIP